jgi:hypothetical protein
MRLLKRAALTLAVILPPVLGAGPAYADNYGEDDSWQFETSADMANMSAVAGMIQQKQGGEYTKTPTIYNSTTSDPTTIENQTNCTVQSTATGNAGANTEGGNSSQASGALASSTGNANTNSLDGAGGTTASGSLVNDPANSGTVGATATGNSTGSDASGTISEALNSTQTNGASQNSTQTGNIACKVSGSGSLN